MAEDRTKRPDSSKPQAGAKSRGKAGSDTGGSGGSLPDFLRRAMTLGFSSLFTTEEAIRKAFGDTVPQDWVDFAALQSDRARAEFLDRLVGEFGRVLENLDLPELIDQVMDGRSLEINAQIRFGPRHERGEDDEAAHEPDLSIRLATSGKATKAPPGPAGRAKTGAGASKGRA